MSIEKISASLNKALDRHLNWNVVKADTAEDRTIAAYERIIEKYAKWCAREDIAPYELAIFNSGDEREIIADYMNEYLIENDLRYETDKEYADRLKHEASILDIAGDLINDAYDWEGDEDLEMVLEVLIKMREDKLEAATKPPPKR